MLLLIINIVHALERYYSSQNIAEFYYSQFLEGGHPTYMSMYGVLLFAFFNSFSVFKTKSLKILVNTTLILSIILFSSKAGTLTLLGTIIIIAFSKKNITEKFLFGLTHIILLFFLLWLNPYSLNRFGYLKTNVHVPVEVSETLDNKADTIDELKTPKRKLESTAARTVYWSNSIYLIKKQPWGYGLCNDEEQLAILLKKEGYLEEAKTKKNPHNQYLHTTLEMGVMGLLALLTFLILPLRNIFKQKHILFLSLLFISSFNMLFESILERQAGLLFVVAFYFIFYSNFDKQHKQKV